MSVFYDDLELRKPAARAVSLKMDLPVQISCARGLPGYAESLAGVDPRAITSVEALADLPVLRKSDLVRLQKADPPFGGLITLDVSHLDFVFQSPGPIYEPGSRARDWWRMARFLRAAGIGTHDIVQNCFGYHMTPAGHMFESGAAALGAAVFPAGTGQTALQAEAAAAIGATAYAGTPDYLKTILEAGDEAGLTLAFRRAVVSGGALIPSLRTYDADRGSACLLCYATSEICLIAYESSAM